MESNLKREENLDGFKWWYGMLCVAISDGAVLLPDFFVPLDCAKANNVSTLTGLTVRTE